jgi:RHS repeat-associated protein
MVCEQVVQLTAINWYEALPVTPASVARRYICTTCAAVDQVEVLHTGQYDRLFPGLVPPRLKFLNVLLRQATTGIWHCLSRQQGGYDSIFRRIAPHTRLRVRHPLPGQYYDTETATHYNYYRDYDPIIGRYQKSDPIGLKGGMNFYAYADSDPILKRDPTGLIPAGSDPNCFRTGECKCATAECSGGLPPPSPGSPRVQCQIVCNLVGGLVCVPVARSLAETGPGMIFVWIVCREFVREMCNVFCPCDP